MKNKIGVIIDCFGLDFKGGVEKAKSVYADGIQAYAVGGEICYDALNGGKYKEINDIVSSNGLVFSALCADFGGHGFMNRDENAKRIFDTKRVVDLSCMLNTNVITTHIGTLTESNDESYKIIFEAIAEVALYAEQNNATLAIETGPEKAIILKEFLDKVNCRGVGANYDPANLVMCMGENASRGVEILAPYIVHTHAKDGVQLYGKNNETLASYKGALAAAEKGWSYLEMPLGEGDVNFDEYLKSLRKANYNGFLTIEREVGDNPTADIERAVEFLRAKIEK